MEINKYIDHTLLKADTDKEQIKKMCEEAKLYNFASVCVNPYYVTYAKQLLEASTVKICTVIGFPLGASKTATKILEAQEGINDGADEFDIVFNISAFKSKQYDIVENELIRLRELLHNKVMKVIIEICYLTDDEIIKACNIITKIGADFVKTSTGFGKYGAKKEVVELMLKTVEGKIKIKAAGGISDYNTAVEYIKMGVDRIGTSKGVELLLKTRDISYENY